MEAIKLIEPYFLQLKGFVNYAQYCVGSEIRVPVCRDFWMGIMIVSFAIALLLTLMIGKRLVKEQLEFYRNKKRLEARKIVAAGETMQKHKWNDD